MSAFIRLPGVARKYRSQEQISNTQKKNKEKQIRTSKCTGKVNKDTDRKKKTVKKLISGGKEKNCDKNSI